MNAPKIILTLNGTPLPKEAQTWEIIDDKWVVDKKHHIKSNLWKYINHGSLFISSMLSENGSYLKPELKTLHAKEKAYDPSGYLIIATLNERIEGVAMLVVKDEAEMVFPNNVIVDEDIDTGFNIHQMYRREGYRAAQQKGTFSEKFCLNLINYVTSGQYLFDKNDLRPKHLVGPVEIFEKYRDSLNTGAIYVEVQEIWVKENYPNGDYTGVKHTELSPIIIPDERGRVIKATKSRV